VGAYGYWVAGLNKGPVSTSTVWAYLFAIGGRLERAHVGLPGLFRRAPDSFYRVFVCEDDGEAIEKANEIFEGPTIELWCGARLVTRIIGQKLK